MDLIATFSKFIREHDLFDPGERLVVGVSGGADSLCLLDLLIRYGAEPVVAHLDHQLRSESGSDAEFVRNTAKRYKLRFELGQAAFKPDRGGSLEEQARLARYKFLVKIAQKHSSEKIVVGHTYDDQVETIIMHLLRGAGPSGLRGMLPATQLDDWVGVSAPPGITLVRPLLAVRRAETMDYCERNKLEPRFDQSNLDKTYFRNRIRHELLPVLEGYNPGVRGVIYNLGEIMRSEVDYLDLQVDEIWARTAVWVSEDALILRTKPIRNAQLALQRGIVRRAIYELRPSLRDLGFEQVERSLAYLLGSNRVASQPVIDDLLIYDYGEDVLLGSRSEAPLVPDYPQIKKPIPVEKSLSGQIELAFDWSIQISGPKRTKLGSVERDEPDAWDVCVNLSELDDQLVIRPRQAGDRIQPLGMSGSVKVSDLMINRKIPRLARKHWPLLVCGDTVVWVPGLHIAHPFRITENNQRCLRFKVEKPPLSDAAIDTLEVVR